MKVFSVVVLLGVLALIGEAQAQDRHTGSLSNGRQWNAITEERRVGFLDGMLQGWYLRGSTEKVISGSVILATTSNGHFTTNELSMMVTSAYSHAENLNLPIGWVALACMAVERGETSQEAALVALRQFLGSLPQDILLDRLERVDPLPTVEASGATGPSTGTKQSK
jgi:hypothetical protein